MVFSWTWNEKKKNAIETLKRHNLNVLIFGRRIVDITEGNEKVIHVADVRMVKKLIEKILSHLIIMLVTHQNVAT